jgi:PleD family two-component response regulator
LGLGLTIVRRPVEIHGGKVHALNRAEGTGDVLKVFLPTSESLSKTPRELAEVHALAVQAAVSNVGAVSLKCRKVLVVDDEPDAREVVAALLERYGATVKLAASAAEALILFERETPHLLVLDIEVPEEDGYNLIRKISLYGSTPQCPGGIGARRAPGG